MTDLHLNQEYVIILQIFFKLRRMAGLEKLVLPGKAGFPS